MAAPDLPRAVPTVAFALLKLVAAGQSGLTLSGVLVLMRLPF
jgi:hypothetical protein